MRRVGLVMVVAVACAVGLPAVAPPAAGAVLQVTIPAPDFNNDGFADLAVGAPGEDVGAATDVGAVNVLYGSAGGLGGGQVLTQGAGGVPGASESFDRFGTTLATGDFNADSFADLVVGAPGETVGTRPGAGAVTILYGDDSGFIAAGSQLFHQGAGVPGTAETGDGLGTALAAGQYGGDVADLAIGVPGEDIGAVADAGILDVLYGTDAAGLGGGSEQLTQQDAAGTVEANDRFGEALSEPFFFLNDVLEDVAVGAPGETVDGRGAAGAGSALFGAEPGGLGDGGGQFFFQGGGGLGGVAESVDQFGAALS